MSSIGIAVSTFGTEEWHDRGRATLSKAVVNQGRAMPYIHVHSGAGLQDARNKAAAGLDAKWVIFLDADDMLAPGYVDAMERAIEEKPQARLFQPSTRTMDSDEKPYMMPIKNMYATNFLVIGTMVNREMFLDLEGFKDMPALEDWDLFIRFALQGVELAQVHDAVYEIGFSPDSRNHNESVRAAMHAGIHIEYKGHQQELSMWSEKARHDNNV